MYSWSKDWPTLTELFFGKGNGPQGKLKGITTKKPARKPIKEVKKAIRKTEMMTKNPGLKIPKRVK